MSETFFDDTLWALRVLMWRRGGDFLRPNPARMPSWSWASLNGRVIFHYKLLQENGVRLLSRAGRALNAIAKVHQLPDNPALPHVQLSASIMAARQGGNCPKDPHWMGPCFLTADPSFLIRSEYQKSHFDPLSKVCFDVEDCQPQDFFVAPLFDDKSGHSSHLSGIHFHVYYLALEKQQISGIGEAYRRIGLTMMLHEGDDQFPPKKTITLT